MFLRNSTVKLLLQLSIIIFRPQSTLLLVDKTVQVGGGHYGSKREQRTCSTSVLREMASSFETTLSRVCVEAPN